MALAQITFWAFKPRNIVIVNDVMEYERKFEKLFKWVFLWVSNNSRLEHIVLKHFLGSF